MDIERGTLLTATTASGTHVRLRALDQPTRGRDFPVVWVCTEQEFASGADGLVGIPWPLDAVEPVAAATAS